MEISARDPRGRRARRDVFELVVFMWLYFWIFISMLCVWSSEIAAHNSPFTRLCIVPERGDAEVRPEPEDDLDPAASVEFQAGTTILVVHISRRFTQEETDGMSSAVSYGLLGTQVPAFSA